MAETYLLFPERTEKEKLAMTSIIQVETDEQIEQARKLFREYEKWLGLDICFQNFEEELLNLPRKYDKPDGRLFLAFVDEKVAGCIALRKLGSGSIEGESQFIVIAMQE